LSSFGIILVGFVSSLLGGAIFAAVFTALGVGIYHETSRMTARIGLGSALRLSGYVVIVFSGSLALLTQEAWGTALVIAIVALLPATILFHSNPDADTFASLMTTLAVSAYIGFSVHAAIGLRELPGTLQVGWADDLGEFFSLTGDSTALGMAWVMVAIVATWMADTCALFVGRAFGRTPLLPHISPKKTLEGAAGAVLGAVVSTVTLVVILGIPDVSIPFAILIGAIFAAVGIYGDLFESFIKRAADVKDSGSSIPGHGGIFDRMDALFPTLLVAWVLATAIH
jgi:phosphatidate cytidylyltransferase